MKAPAFLSVLAVLLSAGCFESVNYDIEEVAPAEFLSGETEPCGDETRSEASHDHVEHEHDGEVHDHDGEIMEDHDSGTHVHGAGVRNHGTQWFFNQPWAASFVWSKMLRDSIILLILAASLLLLPRVFRKRR